MQYKINFDLSEWETPFDGVRAKKTIYGNKQVRLVEYSRKMPEHWCSRGHYGMILEGDMEIEFENEISLFKAGDGVFIPDGETHKHRAKVLTDIVKVIFVEDL